MGSSKPSSLSKKKAVSKAKAVPSSSLEERVSQLLSKLETSEKMIREERDLSYSLKEALNRFLVIENHCELIGRARDINQIIDSLISIAQQVLSFKVYAFYLLDQEKGDYHLRHAQQLDSNHKAIIQSHFDQGIIAWAMSEKRAAVIPDLAGLSQTTQNPTTGFIIVPLLAASNKIGFLEIWPDTIQIRGRNQLTMLELLARQASIAIENTFLYQKLTETNELLKRSQEQTINAEKMAAVGVLASGVAHEINNPLQIILARVQFQNRRSHGPEVDATLKLVEKEAFRISNIVGSILRYAQNQNHPDMQMSRMDVIINDSLLLTHAQLASHQIQVDCQFADDIPELTVNPGQIEQVLLNLIENARHSMKKGGTLYVRTLKKENEIHIEVEDTGHGIPKEYLNRIFDPFFTTKSPNEGTGLGLFLSYGIMQRHHGNIHVESTVGKGTKFILQLPLHPPTPHEEDPHH
jgi:signal transduction histidine kinase